MLLRLTLNLLGSSDSPEYWEDRHVPPLLSNVLNTKFILLKFLRKLMKNQRRINVNVGFC